MIDKIVNKFSLDVNSKYFLINNFLKINLTLEEYFVTKNHNSDNKLNSTIYIKGNIPFLIYSFFYYNFFTKFIYDIFNEVVFIDKKIDLISVEKVLGINNNGKGCITELFRKNDFYNFDFIKDSENRFFFIYILDGNINVYLDKEGVNIKKNNLFIINNTYEKIKLINKLNKECVLILGNLLSFNKKELIYKCNL